MSPNRRVLFLDDDPRRGAAFLAANPDAVWVETVEHCVERLREPWDEVHLDHDLGGEHFVGQDRSDCGMAVVRWLCDAERPHLRETVFVIHSHNALASCAMVFQLEHRGYQVRDLPFGAPPAAPPREGSWFSRLAARFARTPSGPPP